MSAAAEPPLSFTKFGENTTLHGLKYVSDSRSHYVRRCMWLLLLVGSCVGLAVQLQYKFSDYLGNPISTKMSVDYASTLPLPAILLCNTNFFRLSASTAAGMHEVVGDVFNDSDYRSITNLAYPVLREVNGHRFVQDAAHQLKDMLIYCLWPNGTQCTEADFESKLTDYGYCYSINYHKNFSKVAKADNPGIGYGLYLLLNAEDYEAMPGPQRTVGIKVLIYNQTDIPLVSEYGFDLAPGFQTSIGLKYSQTVKLPLGGGGKCGSRPLEFFPDSRVYSRRLCTVDYKYHKAVEACGCLAYNMPPRNDSSVQYCSSQQYFSCMTEAMQASVNSSEAESCPETCEKVDYQQYISFAQLSSPKVGALLSESGMRERMASNFYRAMEAKSRFVGDESVDDDKLIDALLDIYDETKEEGMSPPELMPTGLFNYSCFETTIQDLILANTSRLCIFKDDSKQVSVLQEQFQELGDVNSEVLNFASRLNGSCSTISLILVDIGSVLADSAPSAQNDNDLSKTEILAWVREDQQLSLIRNRLAEVRIGVENSAAQFGLVAAAARAHLADAAAANETSHKAAKLAETVDILSGAAVDCVQDKFMKTLRRVEEVADALSRENLTLVETTLDYACEYLPFCLDGLKDFATNWQNYSALRLSESEERRTLVDEVRQSCRHFEKIRKLEPATSTLNVKENYDSILQIIAKFQSGNLTKAEFAQQIQHLNSLPNFPLDVQLHFGEMGSRLEKLSEAVLDLNLGVESASAHLEDPQLASVYLHLFQDYEGLDSLWTELSAVNGCVAEVSRRVANASALASRLSDGYREAWRALHDRLRLYNDSLAIHEQFYRTNLLALSIYIREMSVEVLEQVPAYGFFSFLCDVGGTLGLFLGASFLTLAELIEYGMGKCLGWWGRRPATQTPKAEPQSRISVVTPTKRQPNIPGRLDVVDEPEIPPSSILLRNKIANGEGRRFNDDLNGNAVVYF